MAAVTTRSIILAGRAALHRDAELRRHAARRARLLDILTGTTLWIAIGAIVAIVVRLA